MDLQEAASCTLATNFTAKNKGATENHIIIRYFVCLQFVVLVFFSHQIACNSQLLKSYT